MTRRIGALAATAAVGAIVTFVGVIYFILVDVDFVLTGERGVTTGAASAVLILVTWSLMGVVYGAVLGEQSAEDHAGEAPGSR
jgi:hypothetical protein